MGRSPGPLDCAAMLLRILSVVLLALVLPACTTLEAEPWFWFGKETNFARLKLGSSNVDADVTLTGVEGSLDGSVEETSASLDAEYALGVSVHRFLTDSWSVGGELGWRRFDLEPFDALGAEINGDPFSDMVFSLGTRYFFEPWFASRRLRPFVGASLGYVVSLETDLEVTYDENNSETVRFDGDAYYSATGQLGFAYLLQDDIFVEIGAAYELPLDPSEDGISIDSPFSGASDLEAEIEPEGLSYFISLNYSF